MRRADRERKRERWAAMSDEERWAERRRNNRRRRARRLNLTPAELAEREYLCLYCGRRSLHHPDDSGAECPRCGGRHLWQPPP